MSAKSNSKAIWLPGNVPSSKNSKQMICKPHPKLIDSKLVRNYRKRIDPHIRENTVAFQQQLHGFPAKVGFHPVRDSRRRFDFHNMIQVLADLMAEYGWIPDDSMEYFMPVPMRFVFTNNPPVETNGYYSLRPKMPGVIIKVL